MSGSQYTSSPSPRSASKKLASPLRCLSLKKFEEPDDETEHLQQAENDPHQDIETAYVGQICLTWEALHCQYSHMSQKISWQHDNPTCYNHSAQEFQQFQVLLQRFIENEPFEHGRRAEIYARTRNNLPKLLHVPNIRGELLVNQLYLVELSGIPLKLIIIKTKLLVVCLSLNAIMLLWLVFVNACNC